VHTPALEAGRFGYEALQNKSFNIKEMNFLPTFQFKQTQEIIIFVKGFQEPTHIIAKRPSLSDLEPPNEKLCCLHIRQGRQSENELIVGRPQYYNKPGIFRVIQMQNTSHIQCICKFGTI